MTTDRTPQSTSAAYLAAAHINKYGPTPRADLFAKIHFSHKPGNRKQMLDRTIASGWLEEIPDGVALTEFSRAHFGYGEDPKPKYQGIPAAPRDMGSAYDRPALSKRFIPNARGFRDDVPEFSVRSAPSFRSVPTGGA